MSRNGRRLTEPRSDASPRSTGGAGSTFEQKVAAHYALTVLAQTEPRGLPGAAASSIMFQRGAQGHHLDDVIVQCLTEDGETRFLDVQVKRTMRFTEKDENFSKVVDAIVASLGAEVADCDRYFAVALERTSTAIDHGVQEALDLARSIETAAKFFDFIDEPGRSNKNIREFVTAFRQLLCERGIDGGDEVFDVLSRFSVLVFDYARPGSMAEHIDRWRSDFLADANSKGKLYPELLSVVSDLNAIGGGKNRVDLVQILNTKGVRTSGAPRLAAARARIAEESLQALGDVDQTIAGVSVLRSSLDQNVEASLDGIIGSDRPLSISGEGGVGKSAALKRVVLRRMRACRILTLAPDRIPPGGWSAYRHRSEIDADCSTFLQDLACDGGGLIAIDSLDRIRDSGQQKTVVDLLKAAREVPGMAIAVTRRSDSDADSLEWLPLELRTFFEGAREVAVGVLDDDEADALRCAAPQLAPLLRPDHPAREFVRNPFLLQRLSAAQKEADSFASEAQLAQDWWDTGGHGTHCSPSERRARRRVLQHVAESLLAGDLLVQTDDKDPAAVSGLVEDGVLLDPQNDDRVRMRHDIFSDWAIGLFLAKDPSRFDTCNLNLPPTFWLMRPIEIAARIVAERPNDTDFTNLIGRLSVAGAAPAWRGHSLLALARSEQWADLFARHQAFLFADDGAALDELLRRAMSAHSAPLGPMLAGSLPEGVDVPSSMTGPRDIVLPSLATWCVVNLQRLPSCALDAAVELFTQLLPVLTIGRPDLAGLVLTCLADLLIANVEEFEQSPIRFMEGAEATGARYPVGRDTIEKARQALAIFSGTHPPSADRFLRAIASSGRALHHMHDVLKFPAHLPSAAPREFCEAFLRAADKGDAETHASGDPFGELGHPFVLGEAGIATFLAVLRADRGAGIALTRRLVEIAEAKFTCSSDAFELTLLGHEVTVRPSSSYGWSRGVGFSAVVSAALMALEEWGHGAIESGEALEEIAVELISDGDISGAFVLVIVDLVLTNGSLDSPLLEDVLASPELLSLDAWRANRDGVAVMSDGLNGVSLVESEADRKIAEGLRARKSRHFGLADVLGQLLFFGDEAITETLRSRLRVAVERLGPWDRDEVAWDEPAFTASHALLSLDRASYEAVKVTGADGSPATGWQFRWPENQARWRAKGAQENLKASRELIRSMTLRRAMGPEPDEMPNLLELAREALAETRGTEPSTGASFGEPKDPWIERVAAAACIARHGDDALLAKTRDEVSEIFDCAVREGGDTAHVFSANQMPNDPVALAVAGLLYCAARTSDSTDFERLLDAVIARPQSGAVALQASQTAARSLGTNVLVALVQAGIESSIFPRCQSYDEAPEAFEVRRTSLAQRKTERKAAEIAWLSGTGSQPEWPTPPPRPRWRRRRGIALPSGPPVTVDTAERETPPDCFFDHRAAAGFFRALDALESDAAEPVRGALTDLRTWLVASYGPDRDNDDDDVHESWLPALFSVAARHAKSWSGEDRDHLVFDVMYEFSEQAFLSAANAFLLGSDLLYIEGDATDTEHLADVRARLWSMLKQTGGWRSHAKSDRMTIEIFLRPIVATFFLGVDNPLGRAKPYTLNLRPQQVVPFLPVLSEIAREARNCPLIADYLLDVLNLLEPAQAADPLLPVATVWAREASPEFWATAAIGRRTALLLLNHPRLPSVAEQVLTIADAIGSAGIFEAEQLREAVRSVR